jgi:ABC-type transport system involved in cytochrome bd biosynthesis fused ATPase/permease subunit
MSRMPPIGGERRWLRIAALVCLALGQAAAAGAAALATRAAFAALHRPDGDLPLAAVAAIAGAGVALAALRWGERVVAERLGQDYVAALRVRLFEHAAHLPASDLAKRRVGTLSLRFVGDLSAVRVWVSLGIGRLLSSAIVLPALMVVLFALDRGFGIAAALVFGCALLVIVGLGPALEPAHRRLRSRRARLAGDVTERLPHAPELRLMGRLRKERRRLIGASQRLIDAFMRRQRRAALLRAIPDVAQGITAALVLWIALAGGLAPALAAGALAAVALMVHPVRNLAGIWDKYGAWVNARRRCEALLARPTLVRTADAATAIHRVPASEGAPGVVFDRTGRGLLQELSLVVEPGEKVGICGTNGAGKSMLLALCAGLEAPERGEVQIAGRRPTDMADAERQRLIAYAGPRSPVLAGSLRRALTLGLKRRPPDELIVSQARRFGLGAALARLGGLDGHIAEGARNLSTGEYRRLLLTRIALGNARMLLLDEPDEGLDQQGMAQVRRFLRERDATIILVSHDWSLLGAMDKICLVQDGRLVEAGSPAQLLANAGPTARLFDPGNQEACRTCP